MGGRCGEFWVENEAKIEDWDEGWLELGVVGVGRPIGFGVEDEGVENVGRVGECRDGFELR